MQKFIRFDFGSLQFYNIYVMKSIISILWFFAWPYIIRCGKFPVHFQSDVRKLNELARNGTKLNEVLKLNEKGFLGEGSYGFVYEGKYLENNNNTTVAIKFVPNYYTKQADDEYEMMTFLKAYKNASVERFGFPAIYYCGRWENFTLIALTKLEDDLFGIAKKYKLKKPLDVLILFRNFVIQSKYMHSHGVRHDDIKPENIMTSGHRSYLIDFNLSSKMLEDKQGYTKKYRAKRVRKFKIRRPIDDWESFLYTISHIVQKDWFKPEYYNILHKNTIVYEDEGLGNVIRAFADEVFTDEKKKRFPNYDGIYQLISVEIAKKHKNHSKFPPVFSWLSKANKQKAKDEFDANLLPKIGDIDEPSLINFETFDYPAEQNLPEIDNKNNNNHSDDQRKSSRSKMCCFSRRFSQ